MMKTLKKTLALLLCTALLLSALVLNGSAESAELRWFSQINGVRFAGSYDLQAVDFSAIINDHSTITDKTLHLIEMDNLDSNHFSWIADFSFSDDMPGVAVLESYPHAGAAIRDAQYVFVLADKEDLESGITEQLADSMHPNVYLFDDVTYYSFFGTDYYANSTYDPQTDDFCVGDPVFISAEVTKADGETVSEMVLTLDAASAAFFTDLNPEAKPLTISVYLSSFNSMFLAQIKARPIAYNNGKLTIELLNKDGSVGTNLHTLQYLDIRELEYCYTVFMEAGTLMCGDAPGCSAYSELRAQEIENIPARSFSDQSPLLRFVEKLIVSNRKSVALAVLLAAPIYIALFRVAFASIRAFDTNVLDSGLYALRHMIPDLLRSLFRK